MLFEVDGLEALEEETWRSRRVRVGEATLLIGNPTPRCAFPSADPDTGIGYCYAPNRLGFGLIDQREIALRDALYRDVLKERSQCP